MSKWVRQIHRWVSIVFSVTVIASFVVMAIRPGQPPGWVTDSPLLPLFVLLFTTMFELPYATKWRSGHGTTKNCVWAALRAWGTQGPMRARAEETLCGIRARYPVMRLAAFLRKIAHSSRSLAPSAFASALAMMACGNSGSGALFASDPNLAQTFSGGTTGAGGSVSSSGGALLVTGGASSGGALGASLGGRDTGGNSGSGGADVGVGGNASGGGGNETGGGGTGGNESGGGNTGGSATSAGGTNPAGGSGGSVLEARVVINEVRGNAPDFVELYNAGNAPADISGYYVTDDMNGQPDLNNLFVFPDNTTLPAHAYVVVLGVNGNVNEGPLSVGLCEDVGAGCYKGNFAVSNGGEQVYLLSPNQSIVDEVAFPANVDTTYGRLPNGTGAFAVTNGATPRASNL